VRIASQGLRPGQNLLVSLLIGTPILWLAALLLGEPPGARAALVYAAAGLLNFGLGRLLFYTSITYAGVATASVLTTPTIIIASMLAWPLLGEPLTPGTLLGLLLVVAGVYLAGEKPSGEPHHGGSRAVGAAAGLASTFVFALSAVLVRYARVAEGGDPLYGAAISYASAIPLGLLLAHRDKGEWSGEHLRYMSVGASLVAIAQLSRYVALSLLPVAVASVLIALFPIHTIMFASLLSEKAREKVRAIHLASAGLSFAGIAIALGYG